MDELVPDYTANHKASFGIGSDRYQDMKVMFRGKKCGQQGI
jgi:hypothetical protein